MNNKHMLDMSVEIAEWSRVITEFATKEKLGSNSDERYAELVNILTVGERLYLISVNLKRWAEGAIPEEIKEYADKLQDMAERSTSGGARLSIGRPNTPVSEAHVVKLTPVYVRSEKSAKEVEAEVKYKPKHLANSICY